MNRMPSLSLTRLLLPAALLASLAGCSILAGGDRNAVTIYAPALQVKVDPSWPTVACRARRTSSSSGPLGCGRTASPCRCSPTVDGGSTRWSERTPSC